MQTIREGALELRGSVIAIGAFDGVHKGHQSVIREAVEKGEALRIPSVVYTFDPPPRHFFQGAVVLTPIEEKLKRIEKLGINYAVVASFDEWYSTRLPLEFIYELNKLKPMEIYVGSNFRFGKNREGDVTLLENHFPVNVTSPVYCNSGKLISSTRIRKLISDGDYKESCSLLGWTAGI
ncbi:FAD synthetase family protein (plasmid) [Bacillus sp. F19]|nr:FAD synthetase family protein [Bacillus sp. F19]